jgi:hypothetical protein
MSRVHRHAAAAPARPRCCCPLQAPRVELAAGDQGPQVERLQRALVKLGLLSSGDFNTGPGILGMALNGASGHIENGWTRHTVVAVGVTASGDVILNDPATGGRTLLSSDLARPQFTGFDRAVSVVN